MQQELGLTSDRVYRWRLIIEEYGPEIIYIGGRKYRSRHDLMVGFYSEAETKHSDQKNWMTFTKLGSPPHFSRQEFSCSSGNIPHRIGKEKHEKTSRRPPKFR